jgi:predicted HTH domain antitoxin
LGAPGKAIKSLLDEELKAVTEIGLYESREAFLSDAVETLFAARPDLREAVACKLYEKGVFTLGRAAEWSRLSIDGVKEALYRRGISREAPESLAEVERTALDTMRAAAHPSTPPRVRITSA